MEPNWWPEFEQLRRDTGVGEGTRYLDVMETGTGGTSGLPMEPPTLPEAACRPSPAGLRSGAGQHRCDTSGWIRP